MRRLLWALVACAAGACDPNGLGRVDASFAMPECPPGTEADALKDYGWDAGYLSTDRFFEIVTINVQEFNVDITETDSVGIQLDLEGLVQAGLLQRDGAFYSPTAIPLVIPVGSGRDQAEVLLSLYRSCERFPGYPAAAAGEVRFDSFRFRIDGADTGDDEVVIGRFDAVPLTYAQAPAPIATVTASFDFRPPNRPLREFR